MTTQLTPHATGPKTDGGKRIAARNATTHGLFARDVVLTHLGEDPAAYEAFTAELKSQLGPRNLMETHYAEKIAAASWRLRRLHRWQAQLFEDPALSEDEALDKLDRVMRHETALHRQIDTSVRMLARELPALFEERIRKQMLAGEHATEQGCRQNLDLAAFIQEAVKKRLPRAPLPPGLDLNTLDTKNGRDELCQNEPAPASLPESSPFPQGEVASLSEPEGVLPSQGVPAPCLIPSPGTGEVARNEPEGVLLPEAGLPDLDTVMMVGGRVVRPLRWPEGVTLAGDVTLASPDGLRVQYPHVTPGPA